MIVRNKHKTANSFPSAPASSRYQLLLINFSSSFSAPLLTVGRGGKGNGGYDQSLTALLCHLNMSVPLLQHSGVPFFQ